MVREISRPRGSLWIRFHIKSGALFLRSPRQKNFPRGKGFHDRFYTSVAHKPTPYNPLFLEGVGSSNVLSSPQTWRNIIIIIIASWNDNPFGNLF